MYFHRRQKGFIAGSSEVAALFVFLSVWASTSEGRILKGHLSCRPTSPGTDNQHTPSLSSLLASFSAVTPLML